MNSADKTLIGAQEVALPREAPVREAVRLIDELRCPMILVTDGSGGLAGTVTDAELRRALLVGTPLDAPVAAIMNREPETVLETERETRWGQAFRPVPVLNGEGRVVGLRVSSVAPEDSLRDRWVVMMAGGAGKRLQPLTASCPKSLLPVGGRPLLEITLDRLRSFGFQQFYFSVNYKAAMIQEHFGDGSRFGVRIEYIHEDKPLGTAGSLSLLPSVPSKAFLVMNADLLTDVDLVRLLDYHEQQAADATLCVYGYDLQIPYGVVQLDGDRMTGLREQPIERYLVNAGIYVLEPSALGLVPAGQPFDMPSLFDALLARQRPTAAFPIREYWLDIGRMSDFERANADHASLAQVRPMRIAAAG